MQCCTSCIETAKTGIGLFLLGHHPLLRLLPETVLFMPTETAECKFNKLTEYFHLRANAQHAYCRKVFPKKTHFSLFFEHNLKGLKETILVNRDYCSIVGKQCHRFQLKLPATPTVSTAANYIHCFNTKSEVLCFGGKLKESSSFSGPLNRYG